MPHYKDEFNNFTGAVGIRQTSGQLTAASASGTNPIVPAALVIPEPGLYEVQGNMRIATLDAGAGATMLMQVAFTDEGGNAKTVNLFAAQALGTANVHAQGSVVVKPKLGTTLSIQRVAGGTLNANGSLVYDWVIKLVS